jgi:hypothetical protein
MTTGDVVVCVHVTVAAGREAEFLEVMGLDAVESRKVGTTEHACHRQDAVPGHPSLRPAPRAPDAAVLE